VASYQHRSGVYDDHLRPIITAGPGAGSHHSGDETPQPTET
jgi:hypothetical protein